MIFVFLYPEWALSSTIYNSRFFFIEDNMKKVLMFSTISITFFLILVILINVFDDAMFSSNNSVKSKNECPYWKGSTHVYGLLSSVTLNEDGSITVTGVQNLCQGQGTSEKKQSPGGPVSATCLRRVYAV